MTVIQEIVTQWGFKADVKALKKARDAAVKAAEDAEEAHKDAALEVKKAQEQVAKATTKSAKESAEAVLKAMKRQERAYDLAASEAKRAASKVSKAFEDAGGDVKASGTSMSEIWTGAMRSIGAGAQQLAVDAVKSLVSATVEATKETIRLGREVQQNAKKIGAGTQEYQKYIKATELVGIQSDNAFEAVKTFRENLGEVARIGTGPAKDALGTLGIELEEIINLPIEEQLTLMSTALEEAGGASENLSTVIEVMGEDGAALLPFLQEGAKGIRRLGMEAEKSGAIMSDRMIETTVKLNEKMARLDQQMQGAKLAIVEALLPAVEDGIDSFSRWTEENQEFLRQDLPAVLTTIAGAAAEVTSNFVEMTKALSGATFNAKKLVRVMGPVGFAASQFMDDPLQSARAGFGGLVPSDDRAAEDPAEAIRQRQAAQRRRSIRNEQRARERFGQFTDKKKKSAIRAGLAAGISREGLADAYGISPGQVDELAGRRGGGGGGRRREQATEFGETEFLAEEEFGDELDRFLEQAGGEFLDQDSRIAARNKAIKAAGGAFSGGATRSVAREAALRSLGQSTGRDLVKGSGTKGDPLLSSLLGEDVPDVELSAVARGAEPQVLVSTITNNFSFDIDQQIEDAGSPVDTGNAAAREIRSSFEDSLPKATKFAKVRFAR